MSPRHLLPVPKQARARETRRRLLDAAVAELVERGYAGLTTPGVAQRAGVSRGAQQNYFPHKRTLVAEAVRHLGQREIADLNERVAAVPRGRARVEVALDILFDQYSGPLFAAVIELSLAVRQEPELREIVADEERAMSSAINATASAIFDPEVAGTRVFAERWATVLGAIRGLALLKLMGHPPDAVDRQWAAARRQLLALLTDFA